MEDKQLEKWKDESLMTIRGISELRQMAGEIMENVISADLALDENGPDNWDERRAAARLCIMRIGQISRNIDDLFNDQLVGDENA